MIRDFPKIGLILAALALTPSCASVFNPHTCTALLQGAQTLEQIAAVLIANGIEPTKAAAIAQAISIGKISLAAACAASNPTPPVNPPATLGG